MLESSLLVLATGAALQQASTRVVMVRRSFIMVASVLEMVARKIRGGSLRPTFTPPFSLFVVCYFATFLYLSRQKARHK